MQALSNKAGHLAETIIRQTSLTMGRVAIVFLVPMMLLTVADVFLRYFFNYAIPASTEFIEYLMVFVGFLGIAWCATKNRHIKVELIVGRFSPRVQAFFNSFNALAVIGVCTLLASQSISESIRARNLNWVSEATDIPWFPFFYVVALGYIILFFVMIIILVRSINEALKR